ncbi:MAG: aspartate aminotransferase [Gallionellales bacterium 35-53-114]|nr:MAG: aspartate aminotransferase [Gallionellales bacterium 35-53-114]OYZ65060.1 MAG: aspartate aminotransferase [Gallionellales bacterium 24-53-125]OZB07968.1 MAG: aspartate aminotransferase [Gallionellales bacterium 39-52-133]HQS59707.1 pyridoxal phosphate-dependent aminotransferase [Gallionellaceae bacterium]HQS76461.1 pyridoxal phosphate-dependent aminotransferase [Gallionellaceae bacterium]
MQLSKRVQAIKPSPTLAVTARAAKLKAEGKDIIGLGTGEPDFDTPQHIKVAAIDAINKGFTKYTAVGGIPTLKQAIIAKFKRDNGLDYTPKQILVSCGGKQSFFNLALAVINPDDEVIISAPYWVSYPDMVIIAEGKPVIVQAGIEQGFKMTPAQLDAAITPRTKMVVINSPSNPSGAVYTLEDLMALGVVLRKHPQVLIVTDDMYEHIALTDAKFVNILNACPDLYNRTMVLNGVSKAYAMTGWRIGYAAGPEDILTAMENVQSQSTSNPTSISQVAAEAALNGDQGCLAPMIKAFRERHVFVVNSLNKIPGLKCMMAGGAFYAFPDARGAISTLHKKGLIKEATDIALSEYLLVEAGVAVVPGSAFGSEGYMRLSFATSMSNLENALARIGKALA